MSQDNNSLKIPVVQVNKPCEECNSTNYPNLQYTLAGFTGVLCRKCLNKEMENINRSLNNQE